MYHVPEIRDLRLEIKVRAAFGKVQELPSGRELSCAMHGQYAAIVVRGCTLWRAPA